MIKYFIWLLPCFLVLSGMGQKANYRQAERFLGSKLPQVAKSARITPNQINQGEKFWYRYKENDGVRYYFVDPKAGLNKEMFDREFMAGEISKINHLPMNHKDLNLNGFKFKDDERTLTFKVDSFLVEYDIFSKHLLVKDPGQQKAEEKAAREALQKMNAKKKKKDKGEKEPAVKRKKAVGSYSPDGQYAVYTRNNVLYLFSEKDSVETRLASDGEKGYSYGGDKMVTKDSTKEASVAVNWWEDSKHFVIQRSDKRKIGTYSLMDNLAKIPVALEFPYERSGDEFVEQYELYLGDVTARKLERLSVEKWKDQKVKLYTVKDKNNIYFSRKRRTCDEIDFCRINPENGEIQVLINEVSKPYFNDDFFEIRLNDNGSEIIWWSERTGHGHFYLYDGEGNLKNAVTAGNWTAGSIVRLDTTSRVLYFYAYGQNKNECPYYKKLSKARLDGKGGVEVLTPEEATHSVTFLKNGYFVDNYSRADLEPRSVVRNGKGKVVVELCSPDLKWLYEMGWKMPEPFTVKSADGVTDLYGYMWKPFDFDSTKTYPIISYVYPGPQTEAIPLEFTPSGMLNTALSQVGFIVVTFGHRGGSPLRERWYHTYGHGNLRDYPLADDKAGIEQLAARFPFIDITKVGIIGHSGGGFMSTAAICTYTDFYTAAVASAGNHDNTIYNRWWGETHHGLKEKKATEKKKVKNPTTGKDSTITEEKVTFEFDVPKTMDLAQNLKGHLMLAFGDADRNVHPANTIRMANALIKAGKNFDIVILPGQDHGYFDSNSMNFFQRKAWFHFAKHLLGDFSSESFDEIDSFMRLPNH